MRRTLLLALSVALLAGCGGDSAEDDDGFPPAAEPAEAPELTTTPAGQTISLGSGPEGLTIDAETGLAAVGTREPPTLTLVDVDSLEVTETVPLDAHPRHLQLEGPGGPVLVPAEDSDELIRVELPTGTQTKVGVGDFPHDATASGDRIFVGDEFGDTISVVEGDEVIDTLEAPVQPGGVIASGGLVGVIAVSERVLTTYDPQSLDRLGTISAGEGPTHIVAAGSRAFVADTEGDAVLEFRLSAKPKLTGETRVDGTPYGIAVDQERNRLWVTLTATNEAVEYDITRNGLREVERYPTVQQPNTIAVDPRTGAVLISGATEDGQLQKIEPN